MKISCFLELMIGISIFIPLTLLLMLTLFVIIIRRRKTLAVGHKKLSSKHEI